ncbi:homogentisate 1,2-dioxygenase [bacterium]|nr:homogentisate 1,2-dioxygenase [bacterium]
MPFYHKLGKIPRKRHTIFKQEDGSLYQEHLMGTLGFSGPASLLYHIYRPTEVISTKFYKKVDWQEDPDGTLRMRHFRLSKMKPAKSAVLDRVPLLFNNDVALGFVVATETDDFWFRNSQGDEIIYVSEGEGVLESLFGDIPYNTGDYLVIPRGIHYRLTIEKGPCRFLVIETPSYVRTPNRYRNEHGQLMEHSPFCERDIRPPESLAARNDRGEFKIMIKRDNALHESILAHHPMDVVGWDGYYYPWAFNIDDFEPLTGSLHQPPPAHQTFAADGFVVCSFVPRLFDYHPEAIPAPYNHSNVMSDEILYYANDEFMSRKGIEYGSLTVHPIGYPHGPQPGKYEGSIGVKETKELAVMLDTFRPLKVAKSVLEFEDESYKRSWLDNQ